MKDTVSHYVPPHSPLTSTEPQVFSNNLTMPFKVVPGQLDRSVDFYKESVLPALEDLEGFCSASLLIDRSSGRAVSSATFDSREAMDRNKKRRGRCEPRESANWALTRLTYASSSSHWPICESPS